ncbi:MAG: alpha/beta fold hydrolase [Dehalococcoidia bacterium]
MKIHYEVAGEWPGRGVEPWLQRGRRCGGRRCRLSERYRVITWDMRGHGESDSPDDPALYSEAHSCADIAAILGELGIAKAVIGGLSLGGYTSFAFNVRYPR